MLDSKTDQAENALVLERYISAGNPATEGTTLDELAEDKQHLIRARVAENPNTPLWTLLRLVNDDHEQVRLSAFFNPQLPESEKLYLARDPHVDVRYALAEDALTAVDILDLLADDENVYVQDRAKKTLQALCGGCEKMAA
jgi:3-methyladenine DNA glycosylase AlkC